jgi:hypothetical protein
LAGGSEVSRAATLPATGEFDNVGKVTGGGWINALSGEFEGEATMVIQKGPAASIGGKATFGFVAQRTTDQTPPTGNLVYIDHVLGVRIKALTFDNLVFLDTCTAMFTGIANVNGIPESMTVWVVDGGEPGSQPNPGVDTFAISTDSYFAAGPLFGGNIQIHGALMGLC